MTEGGNKILYPELSYKIIGLAYKIYNDNGYGFSEKYYQNVFQYLLSEEKIKYKREFYVRKELNGKTIIKYYLDFYIEDRVVVELKVRPRLGYVHIKQVMDYLKICNCELAIIIYFTKDGVKYRRVLNSAQSIDKKFVY